MLLFVLEQKKIVLFMNSWGVAFVQVAEAVPLDDASVDAVVGTLVLCSVKDVNMALKGSLAL